MGLSPSSKLFYLYLITQPNISTLGVLAVDKGRVKLDLGIDDFYKNGKELESKGFLRYFSEAGVEVFIIKRHFLSLSRSKLNIRRAIDEGKSSPYIEYLRGIYIPDDFKPLGSFVLPTPKEVSDYALKLGYLVNGNTFVNYYSDNDWYNKNNKKVRNWKATLKRVWCREENKLGSVKGSPSGYEFFYVELENGDRVSPEGWKDGYPTHSNYLHAELLVEEFSKKQ
jgi:hypothetical protein